MGEIKVNNIAIVRTACAKELCRYLNDVENLSEINLLYFLILITQLVFAKFYYKGIQRNNSYYVYPRNVEYIFAKEGFPGYFTAIVELRNALCHEFGIN